MKPLPAAFAILLLASFASADMPLMWEYRVAGSVSTDLVLDGGVVYVGTSSGKVYGLNVTTGRPVMNVTSTAGVYSTPLVSGDFLVFGCDNKVVYAVNKSTGNRTWSFLSDGKVRSSPASAGETVYVGSDDTNLYALRAVSGKMVWRYRTGTPVQSKPFADGWKVFFGGQDRRVYVLSNITGAVIWNQTLPGQLKGEPAVYKDIVYFASSDKRLYALDRYSGKRLWNYTLNGTVVGSPQVVGDAVVFAASDRKVYAVSAYFGENLWNATLDDVPSSPPSVYGDLLFVGAGNKACSMNASSGELFWCFNASSSQIRYRIGYSDGVLLVPTSSSLQAYGGSADLGIVGLRTEPKVAVAGRPLNLYLEVANFGNALASDVDLEAYVDRGNLSVKRVSVSPGGRVTVGYNVTVQYGRHVAEAVLDKSSRFVESRKGNNRFGVVFSATSDWPAYKGNGNRTGILSTAERYAVPDQRLSWTCSLNQSNRTLSSAQVLWDLVNSTDDFRLRDLTVNSTCYLQQTRGFFTGRMNSTWSCAPVNWSGCPDRNFALMKDYLATFNETTYNLSVRHNALYYPFNITDYAIQFNCTASPTPELPLDEAGLAWDCRLRRGYNITPYNLLDSWSCTSKYYSNYSMEDLAALKGYLPQDEHIAPRKKADLSRYGLLWAYDTSGNVDSSPVIVDLLRRGDGRLDIVFGSEDGTVRALDSQGKILWEAKVNSSVKSLSVADLEGDGDLVILAGLMDGRLLCLSSWGNVVWAYQTGGQVTSSALAYNLDDTPELEVVFGSWDGRVYALDHGGRLMWDYRTSDAVASSIALGDIDGDKKLELIFGSNENVLYALKTPPYKVWMYQTSGDIATPAVAGIYGSRAVEFLAPSGDGNLLLLYYGSAGEEDQKKVCDAKGCRFEGVEKSRLNERWAFHADGPIESSPAVADLNRDGNPEIIVGASDKNVYLLNKTGYRLNRYTTSGPVRSSPAVADLEGTGLLNAVVGSDDGRVYVLNSTGDAVWSYETGGAVRSSPAVSDINNDGLLEIAVGSDDGRLYVFGVTTTTKSTTTISTTTVTTASESTATTTTAAAATTSTTALPFIGWTVETGPEAEELRAEENLGYALKAAYVSSTLIMGFYFALIMRLPRKPREIRLSRV